MTTLATEDRFEQSERVERSERLERFLLLRRPLFLALLLGFGVSVLGSGRFTLRLIVDGTLSFAFVPLCELLGFAAVYGLSKSSKQTQRFRSFASASDRFFATNVPWLWWSVGILVTAAILPASRLGSILAPLLMTAPIPIVLSAVLEWRFLRGELGHSRSRAATSLFVQRAIAWSAATAYFLGVAITRRDFLYLFVEMGQEMRNWVETML